MRWILRSVAVLVCLALVALVGLFFLPGDRIAQVAADQIRAQTGREVRLSGETQVSYYPVLGVSTGAVEIANADWSDNGPLLRADSLKLGVDLAALIGGEIKITGLEAVNPAILLERAANGRANWQIGVDGVAPSGQAAGTSDNALALTLDRALISGGSLRYLDHGSGADTRVGDIDLDVTWPVYRGTATFALAARPAGKGALTLSGEVSDLAGLIEGQIVGLTAEAQLARATMSFAGRVGLPLQAEGRVSAQVPSSADLLTALGIDGAAPPNGLGQAVDLSAQVTLTEGPQLSLRDLSLQLDHTVLSGALDLDLAPSVPQVTARFGAGVLDLSALSDTGQTRDTPAQQGWSRTRIDASALGLVDGQLRLDLAGLRVAGLSFGPTTLQITNERSRAVARLVQMTGYEGRFSGQVVANNRNGLSVGGDLQASGVALQPLLSDLIGVDRFTGAADLSLSFLGAGDSVDRIMKSLSGEGRLAMGRGTIQGIDLDRLLRGDAAGGGTTVFDSLGASFTMREGDLHNRDLLLQLPLVSASGAGRVGLGARDIDYTLVPKTGAAGQGGIAIPVRIKGPWANPRIWPDLEQAIELNLKAEKDAAKKEVEARVKKELGLENRDGESLEDAAKRKLEEEVLKGLGNLFK